MIQEIRHALPYRIGCSLKPSWVVGRLLCSQNIHKSIAEMIEIIRVFNVAV